MFITKKKLDKIVKEKVISLNKLKEQELLKKQEQEKWSKIPNLPVEYKCQKCQRVTFNKNKLKVFQGICFSGFSLIKCEQYICNTCFKKYNEGLVTIKKESK